MEPRDKIIAEASKLLFHYGFKSFTMDYLAKRMGISKRTLYEIFPNKEQLIAVSIQSFFDMHTAAVKKTIKEATSPIEAIIKFIITGLEHYSYLPYGFFKDLKRFYSDIYRGTVSRETVTYRRDLELLILSGMDQGLFTRRVSARKILALYGRSLFSIYQNEARSQAMQRLFLEMGIEHTFIYLRGICTIKGLQECDKLLEETKEKYIRTSNI